MQLLILFTYTFGLYLSWIHYKRFQMCSNHKLSGSFVLCSQLSIDSFDRAGFCVYVLAAGVPFFKSDNFTVECLWMKDPTTSFIPQLHFYHHSLPGCYICSFNVLSFWCISYATQWISWSFWSNLVKEIKFFLIWWYVQLSDTYSTDIELSLCRHSFFLPI